MAVKPPLNRFAHFQNELEIAGKIAKAKLGDERDFAWLTNFFRRPVAAIAYKMTGDYEASKEITQIVFFKVHQNLWRYEPQKSFYTWLYRITFNTTIDHLRRKKRQPCYQDEPWEGAFDDIESPDGNPETLFAEKELLFFISAAADRLPDKQHTAFQLREMDGWPITDVAAFLGIPEATVRWHIHRARLSIRKYLANQAPHLLSQFGIKSR